MLYTAKLLRLLPHAPLCVRGTGVPDHRHASCAFSSMPVPSSEADSVLTLGTPVIRVTYSGSGTRKCPSVQRGVPLLGHCGCRAVWSERFPKTQWPGSRRGHLRVRPLSGLCEISLYIRITRNAVYRQNAELLVLNLVLSVWCHWCPLLITYTLFLPEAQTGEAWEP
jgi:hypothetical protein